MSQKSFRPEEAMKLEEIERLVSSLREETGQAPEPMGSRAAGRLAGIVGSWKFLGALIIVLGSYIGLNALLLKSIAFDPYPFILLNLFLSFQAAFTAPIILMASNRAESRDRRMANKAYRTIGHIEELVKILTQVVNQSEESEESEESV